MIPFCTLYCIQCWTYAVDGHLRLLTTPPGLAMIPFCALYCIKYWSTCFFSERATHDERCCGEGVYQRGKENGQMIVSEVHSLPFQQFQALLTLFSKSFSPFPHGTCLLSVSTPPYRSEVGRRFPPRAGQDCRARGMINQLGVHVPRRRAGWQCNMYICIYIYIYMYIYIIHTETHTHTHTHYSQYISLSLYIYIYIYVYVYIYIHIYVYMFT